MIRILTLCTGNVCRSPYAAQLFAARLDPMRFVADSAGISPLAGDQMPGELQRISRRKGVAPAQHHRARGVGTKDVVESDLIIAMARHHRRAAVLIHPPAVQRSFTLLELSHVVSHIDAKRVLAMNTDQPNFEFAVLETLQRMRGAVPPLFPHDLYDVEDPYGRSMQAFERSAKQIETAVELIAEFFDQVFATHLTIRNERYQRS